MANLSNINNKFLVTTGGNVLIGQTSAVGSSILQVTGTMTADTVDGTVITDGFITMGFAQLNRYGAAIELQYTPTNAATLVKIGANGSNPTIFNAYTGDATFAGNVSISVNSATSDTLQINNGSVRTHLLGSESSNGVIYMRSSANSNTIRINASGDSYFNGGNVGIGTTSPSEKLEVSGSNTLSIKLSRNDTDATYVTTLTNNYSSSLGTELKSGMHNILTHGNTTGTALNFTNGAMTFDFRNSEYMRITEAGNVGIGTTSPASPLSVVGSYSSSDEIVEIGGGTGINTDFKLKIGAVDQDYIWFQSVKPGDNYYDLVFNPTAGNVGIGTTNPVGKLTVQGDDADIFLRSNDYTIARLINRGSTGTNLDTGLFSLFVENTENVRIDANGTSWFNGGNVGIGTTSPNDKLEVSGGNIRIYSTNNANHLIIKNNATGTSGVFEERIKFLGWNDNENAAIIAMGNAYFGQPVNVLAFQVSGSEKMRITHGGDLYVGTTSTNPINGFRVLQADGGTFIQIEHPVNTSSGSDYAIFRYNQSIIGTIRQNGTSQVQYNVSSDYRLKEDLQDFAGLELVSKIPVYDYKWKSSEDRSYGVMAHELQEVLPDAVSGEKDAEEMQGVDYSKIVPLLVKAIQELEAKIKILENK